MVVTANGMLSSYLVSIFLELISIVDFKNKVRKIAGKLLFTDSCLVEEMEDEFLGIWQFFPYGRQKGRLPISKLDNQSAMFLFQEIKQFRRISEILLISRGKDGDSDIEVVVLYLVHGQ